MNVFSPTENPIMKWLDSDSGLVKELEKIRTPAYVYSYRKFKEGSARLARALSQVSSSVSVFYSMKANAARTMMKWTREAHFMTEVSSIGELRYAMKSGQTADNILLLGPGKHEELMDLALELHIFGIAVESFRELSYVTANHNGKTRIFIRINADRNVPGVTESMFGPESKFGIDISRLGEALEKLDGFDSDLVGIHYYMGSQLTDHETMLSFHREILTYVARYRDRFNSIDMGGGFGIPYSENEHELDLDAFATGLGKILSDLSLEDKHIYFESGRYIAADAGVFLTRIMDVKGDDHRKVLVTDGGMNDFMRIAFMKEHHPIAHVIPDRSSSKMVKSVISGPLCTPLDCFATSALIPADVKEGDMIAIFKAGAYGLTLSPVFFLLHSLPSEYAVRDGGISEITRKDLRTEEIFSSLY